MNIKEIFWPWGRIKELNGKVACLSGEIDDLEDELEDQDILIDILKDVTIGQHDRLLISYREVGLAALALHDITATVAAIKVPNGTTKKLSRIASDAMDAMTTSFSSEYIAKCRDALVKEREILAEAERENVECYDFSKKVAALRAQDMKSRFEDVSPVDDATMVALTIASAIPAETHAETPSYSGYDGGSSGGGGASGSWDSGSSSSFDSGSFGGGCD